MKMNKYMLMVLEELKDDPYFYKQNNLLLYTISKDCEALDDKTFGGKVTAVWDLHKLGAIKIHNKGEERIPGTMNYEFQILIVQSSYEGIYKKCIKDVKGQSLEEYESQIQTSKNLPALRKKLNLFIRINKFGKKETKFLQLLSIFEPILLEDLAKNIPTKDIESLKKIVKEKIRGSGFYIKTVPTKSFNKGAYQLINFPPTNT